MKAQRDLGVDIPAEAITAYEDVIDRVDLASIAARERVTRHDVKARIDILAAYAGLKLSMGDNPTIERNAFK